MARVRTSKFGSEAYDQCNIAAKKSFGHLLVRTSHVIPNLKKN